MVLVAPFVCALIFVILAWRIFKWTVIGTLVLAVFLVEMLKAGISRLLPDRRPNVPGQGAHK